jgi:hypothetical protein
MDVKYTVYAFGDNPNESDPARVPEGLRGPLPHPDNAPAHLKLTDWLDQRLGLKD